MNDLFQKGLSYSLINTAKSAIADYVNFAPYRNISDHPTMKAFTKGVYNIRPPKPKLSTVWEVKVMFNYIETLGPNEMLSDKDLNKKLLILLLLLGGQRINTIHAFHINHMIQSTNAISFIPQFPLKHNRSQTLDLFTYRAYPINELLCVMKTIEEYLKRRVLWVNTDVTKLFITHGKPRKAATIDTLRRWVKNIFSDAGVINFSPHSCRSASTSKAKALNVDMEKILKQGCWKNLKTFKTFYNKEIINSVPENIDFYKIME